MASTTRRTTSSLRQLDPELQGTPGLIGEAAEQRGGVTRPSRGLRTAPRKRRTRDELAALDAEIFDILEEDHPQSVRHVFYRLTDRTRPVSVPKLETGYKTIGRRCTAMRRAGRLPYSWLTDATRRGYLVNTFANGGDLIRAFAGLYRVDAWQQASSYVEVWTESRSIAGVVEGDCTALGVPLYPCGGFASLSLAYQAAEGIKAGARGRPVRIVYIGDYDPAGVLIDRSVISELRGHLPGLDIEEVRIAITAAQAERLPSKPRKAGDRRRPDIRETVEAEAMPAGELRMLLRETVESYMPAGALAAARVAEQSEQAGLARLGDLIGDTGLEYVIAALEGDGA